MAQTTTIVADADSDSDAITTNIKNKPSKTTRKENRKNITSKAEHWIGNSLTMEGENEMRNSRATAA